MTFVVHEQLRYPLSAHVANLYHVQGAMPFRQEKVLPSPNFDLKINLGGPIVAWHGEGAGQRTACQGSWCVGIWDGHHIVEWPEDTHFVGVTFHPGGAYAVLGIPLSEFHNSIVPLEAIWSPAGATEVRQRLGDAPTPGAALDVLEEVLTAQLRGRRPGLDAVRYALKRIGQNDGTLTVRALCADVGVSQRHLGSLFKQVVGATPKELARLSRFSKTIELINAADERVDLTAVAYAGHYFDQAHFCKDFRLLTGESPSEYLAHRRQVHQHDPGHARHLRLMPAD